jgi:nicotinate-nucleotide pyrophosphorylase (carboxylating)
VSTQPPGPLDAGSFREVVRRALAEDLGWGDVTTNAAVPPGTRATGTLFARGACVLAGLDLAAEAFRQLDPSVDVTPLRNDGERCQAGERIAVVRGLAHALLTGERTALNFLRHLSGVATVTRAFVDAAGGRIAIADTRKTMPLLRALEKAAVVLGGGVNGRATLDDGVVIKANHARLGGGIGAVIGRVRSVTPEAQVEVEVTSLDQVEDALEAGAAVVLVTRFSAEEIREIVRRCRGRARVEISGSVTLEHVVALASTGADYVSIGALTDSANAADISLELEPV